MDILEMSNKNIAEIIFIGIMAVIKKGGSEGYNTLFKHCVGFLFFYYYFHFTSLILV